MVSDMSRFKDGQRGTGNRTHPHADGNIDARQRLLILIFLLVII